ncbi:hypothetical protein RFI_13061, partial [Reticulomyxa filosa]
MYLFRLFICFFFFFRYTFQQMALASKQYFFYLLFFLKKKKKKKKEITHFCIVLHSRSKQHDTKRTTTTNLVLRVASHHLTLICKVLWKHTTCNWHWLPFERKKEFPRSCLRIVAPIIFKFNVFFAFMFGCVC